MITPNADLGKSLQSRMSTSRDRTAALQGAKFGLGVAHRESEPAKSHAVPAGLALERRGLPGSIGITGWRNKRPTALNYLRIGTSALMITETLTDS